MRESEQATRVVRFGVFEVNLQTAELRKLGVRIRLPGQSFQVLEALLLRPGELVTREELKQKLWPSDTFGDFEHGLNAAVNRVREALGDSSDNPRFVETIPRRGYRFVAPINGATQSAPAGAFDVISVAEPRPAAPGSATPVPQSLSQKPIFWKVTAAIVLVAGVAVGSYDVLRSRIRPDVQELRAVPFNGLPGNAFPGSFSPDGQMIVFMWDQDKPWPSFDEFVQMVGGDHPLQVTHYSGWGEQGVWSPDGKSIALIKWSLPNGKLNDIVLVPALGGHEVVLEHDHFPHWIGAAAPSWFPDGRRLAFPDFVAGGSAIFLLRLDDLTRTQLTWPPGTAEDDSPKVSPDGTEIAFVRNLSYGVTQLAVLSLDSRRIRILSTESSEIAGLTWDENGSDIIYASDRSGIYRLWRVSAKGGDARLINVGDDAIFPVISARTHRLAYSRSFVYNHIWSARLGTDSSTSKTGALLITSSRSETEPQISPDESKIAFVSDRSGASEIWVSKRDGSDPMQLTHMETRVTGFPRWSPEGQLIAFDSQVLGHYEVYVVDLRGGMPRRITNGPVDSFKPGWSSDGKWIYYSSKISDQLQIWKIPAQGGQPIQVTQHGGEIPFESADGRTLYFLRTVDVPEIWQKPLPDGEEKRLPGMPELEDENDWEVTKDGIFFVAADTPREPQSASADSSEPLSDVGFFDFSNGRARTVAKLAFSKVGANGISVSRDGHTMLYTHTDSNGAEIMIVDKFH